MKLVLPIVAALVSIIILPAWSFYFEVTPKVVVVLIGAALALLRIDFRRLGLARPGKMLLALAGLQAVTAILATIFSTHPALSFFGSTWRKEGLFVELSLLILAVAICASLSSEERRLRIFLRITVLASILPAAYGIAQYFGIDPLLPSAAYHFGEGRFAIVRPPSTLGHADYFATFLLYAAFGGIALAQMESQRAWKAAALVTSAISAFAIVLSGTRAAIIGALAGGLFVILRDPLLSRRWRQLAAGVAAGLVLIAAFYISPAGERLRARAFWSRQDSLGGARLLLWRDSLRMSEAHWIRGYGPESFVVEFSAHESIDLAKAYPDFYHESPHNIFLEALVANGVLGLAALAGMAILGLWLARGAVGAAFVAILVSQQFTSFTVPTQLYFYVSLAILAAAATTPVSIRRPGFGWVYAAPLLCLAIYLGWGDATLAAARRALDRGEVGAAAREVAHARQWHAAADIYFSRRFLAAKSRDPLSRLRAWGYGLEAAQSAPQSADDPMNAYVNLASFYAAEGDAANVERNLRASMEAAPNWFQPHRLLARVLDLEGRRREAAEEAQAAAERNSSRNREANAIVEPQRSR